MADLDRFFMVEKALNLEVIRLSILEDQLTEEF